MKLFLTSSTGGCHYENDSWKPCALDGSNHFLENLKANWPDAAKCLMMSSDPENIKMNDLFASLTEEAFKISKLPLSAFDVCDSRNENEIADIIYAYDVLILAGGHVPTQNRFFAKLNLCKLIKAFEGIVIGISAGTMNCADVVYAQPELDGEAADPEYKRYLEGLHLMKISVLPHFQEIKEQNLDGLRLLEDISFPDSKTKPIYALNDGSYIIIDNNSSTLYGEAYLIKDGILTQICESDKSIRL